MDLDLLEIPAIHLNVFDLPGKGLTESAAQDRHTGLADGRQTLQCPRTRTALPQLMHQDAYIDSLKKTISALHWRRSGDKRNAG